MTTFNIFISKLSGAFEIKIKKIAHFVDYMIHSLMYWLNAIDMFNREYLKYKMH